MLESTRRQRFIDGLPARTRIIRFLQRDNLYVDMMSLFKDPQVVEHYPFAVVFQREKGVDTGGLSREAFSTFWEEAYSKHFDGSCLVTPRVCAGLKGIPLQILGRILSYGYISCGFLPVRIAFPTLAAILLTSFAEITDDILLQTFKVSLSPVDLSSIKEALSIQTAYPQGLLSKLINIFSRFDCLEVPNPGNILRLCQHSCRWLYIDKPFSAIVEMRKGVPSNHMLFWDQNRRGVSDLFKIYLALTATPAKVLQCIEEPPLFQPSEQRIFDYLTQYIGRMKVEEVQLFLRFCTGSSVCIEKRIQIEFNSLSGFERRPIAHTCSCTLEIPRSYTSYMDFTNDFKAVLEAEEHGWQMDTI